MNRYDAVLFDLDGTLVDSLPDLATACAHMRQALGLPPLPLAHIRSYVGKGSDVLIARVLANRLDAPMPTPALFAQAKQAFQQAYQACNGQQSQLYPGVLAGLQALRDAGLPLAVVTNKPSAFALPLLQQLGLAHYFSAVVCGDTCERKKPHPDPVLHACAQLGVAPRRAVMVGDSLNDAQAGQAAHCAVLLLPYGYNEGKAVQALNVDAIVDSIAHVAAWVLNKATP